MCCGRFDSWITERGAAGRDGNRPVVAGTDPGARAGRHACDLCGHDNRLEVHHRTYARLGFERQSDLFVLAMIATAIITNALVLRAIRATEHAPLTVSAGHVLKRATV